MRIKYYILPLLLCVFILAGVSFEADYAGGRVFAQDEEEAPELSPQDIMAEEGPEIPTDAMIEELLADEEIPEEIKREIERALRPEELEFPEEENEFYEEDIPFFDEEDYGDEEEDDEDYEDYGEDEEAPEEVSIEPPAPASRAVTAPAGAVNRISLDLKGVDIIDVIKMLSARSNLNIVAGKNVRGKVTLFLKDVDTWDAFEIILAANNLAYDKRGDIINVMTERDYEQIYGDSFYTKKELRVYRLEYAKAEEVTKALSQVKSKIGKVVVDAGSNTVMVVDSPQTLSNMEILIAELDIPVETRIFSLDYAKAEDLKTKLSEMLTKGVGSIQVDERTNKMVITELSKRMPEIASIIMEMDERHKEVLIETKIVQVELTDEYKYGVDWRALFNRYSDEGARSYLNNLGDVFGGSTTGGALTITSLASGYFEAAMEALQSVGKTNVISCPRITVLNNEEAKVLVGTNQPYVTTTTTVPEGGQSITAEDITYVDIGISLTVTPTVNNNGYVTMKIKPEVSSAGTPLETASGNDIPVVSTSETETTVMVKDGTTIVIAGLIEDRDILDEDKIPILGDIPLIGELLFKSKTVGSSSVPEKKELVVFLTPYVVEGSEIFPESENVWYGDSMTQRGLLEQQISLAVRDLEMKRSHIGEIPEREKKVTDTATRISGDIKWIKEAQAKEEVPHPEEEAAAGAAEAGAEEAPEEKEAMLAPMNLLAPTVSGYYVYYENLRNKIYWTARDTYPENFKGGRQDVKVIFKLASNGSLKGEPEVLNPVDRKLANAAKEAVKASAPFAPFPKKMEEEEAVFKITISYE